ncbi:hypothetical protein GIB67_001199 [Kingdonia uniflora]|uniref:Uncharacterized protein n=1 Tax=Kingdonia uniflora TaxID=39325 RepID=A0A7J7LG78_9MAGN|nr:hypothetical protein GIB67_001199 [Kingdonia uniflora]
MFKKRALQAEEDLKRGRTKLKQAGNQIQDVVRSAYKIEGQARGLKDILRELPSREASRFRSQKSGKTFSFEKEILKIEEHFNQGTSLILIKEDLIQKLKLSISYLSRKGTSSVWNRTVNFCMVSNLASEAKRERNALNKEVARISNYGISI